MYEYGHKQVRLRIKRWNDNAILLKINRSIHVYENRKLKRGWPRAPVIYSIVESPVLDSFDINRENARVFCSPGFYLRKSEHHLASQEGKNSYATYQGMYEHNLYSLRYLCTFSYFKNNSKFTGSLLKVVVLGYSKMFPSFNFF